MTRRRPAAGQYCSCGEDNPLIPSEFIAPPIQIEAIAVSAFRPAKNLRRRWFVAPDEGLRQLATDVCATPHQALTKWPRRGGWRRAGAIWRRRRQPAATLAPHGITFESAALFNFAHVLCLSRFRHVVSSERTTPARFYRRGCQVWEDFAGSLLGPSPIKHVRPWMAVRF